MDNDADNQLAQRAAYVDGEGRKTYGDAAWTTLCGAMGAQGVTPQVLAPLVARGDAVEALARLGQEAVLRELQTRRVSDPNYSDLENAYSKVRNHQRHEHRMNKGRD
jgi:hypothetical protein